MQKSDFTEFVRDAVEDVVGLAEERAGKAIPRQLAFRWLGSNDEPIRERIVETIVNRVFVDENKIYPCVDLGVLDILDDGTPLLVAGVAGYDPRPFGRNWTDRDGPFVRIIGNAFLAKMQGQPWPENALISFIAPDMKNLK
jgi:hypothetical protein